MIKANNLVLSLIISASLLSAAVHADTAYRLGTNDVVRVTVYGQPDLSAVVQVSENGSIVIPTIGEVGVAGLTAREAEIRLANILERREVVRDAQVGLIIESYESKRVAVLGEVANPGVYAITRGSTVMDMISEAGGLSQDAGDLAILTRRGGNASQKKTVIDLPALLEGRLNTPEPSVKDGDRIYVPRMEQFYVYGEVNQPGVYRLEPGMTVIQALSVAGGITDKGTKRGMSIRRTTKEGREQTIPASLTHSIEPNDVLYVKESLF